MSMGRDQTVIWNRAASIELAADAREGDRALHHVLEFHGYVMNGGLDHALDVMGHEAQRAIAGWEFLDRQDVADLLREALGVVPDMPEDADARQDFFIDGWTEVQAEAIEALGQRYPGDDVIEHAFSGCLNEDPDAFAPVV